MGWRMLALCGAVFLCLWAIPAQALVVTIDLGWGYNAGWTSANAEDNLISNYNLQEGSIVQVIMYNSANASAPGNDADDNFDSYLGDYSGTGIAADPYAGDEPSHVPSDLEIYDPYTVPSGHTLAYQTEIGSAISGSGGYWYNIYEQFEILGTYNSLYIRVFGTTDFDQGVVISSYWGLSDVETSNGVIDTWYVDPIDNTVANHTNYFEVIPEPGTMALFLLGGTGLLAGVRRRQKRS